jgi:hypothetical protein
VSGARLATLAVLALASLVPRTAAAESTSGPYAGAFRKEIADAMLRSSAGDAQSRRGFDPLGGLRGGYSGIVLAATGLAMVLTLPLAGSRILSAAPDPAQPQPAAPRPRASAGGLDAPSGRGRLDGARSAPTFVTGVVLAAGGTFALAASGVLSAQARTGESEQTVVAFAVCGATALIAAIPLVVVSLGGAEGPDRVRARLEMSPTMVGVSGSF